MRELWRGLTALAASAALVLHLLLTALTPAIAVPAGFDPAQFDPYAITCLNGGHGAAGGAPEQPAQLPTHQCDLCVMCAAVALPAPEQAGVAAAPIAGTRLVALPAQSPRAATFEQPRLPRGPPQAA